MSESTVSVSLPEGLLHVVSERVRDGDYADEAAYLVDLVARDREARAVQRLRALIDEGLASGPATPLTDDDLAAIQRRIEAAGR